jgi:hypothetical protein
MKKCLADYEFESEEDFGCTAEQKELQNQSGGSGELARFFVTLDLMKEIKKTGAATQTEICAACNEIYAKKNSEQN